MRPAPGVLLGGRYELAERIAVGGMGEVWAARDQRLARAVAAKVLRAELAGNETFLARLRAEARNTAALSHPNIATLLDHGEQEGSGYLVMELVDGEPMSTLLEREATVPVRTLLPVLAQVARGLHAAHVIGVVHRDVKPGNVLITRSGHVKLTDFGISRARDQARLTAAGRVMGTAQYLAPEQARGRPASPAGDVYALGVIAYEALTGRRPYTGVNEVDIATKHVNDPLPPLPARVPPGVRRVVEQMLAKSPADRPRSAAVLAHALETALEPSSALSAPTLGTLAVPAGALAPAGPGAPAGSTSHDRPTARGF